MAPVATTIRVKPLPLWSKMADRVLYPFMHLATGTFITLGRPQQTHSWHVQSIDEEMAVSFLDHHMVHSHGDPKAGSRYLWGLRFLPRCHLPWLPGGWRRGVIIEPEQIESVWHVGWISPDSVAVHRLSLRGPVRMLVGPDSVMFFALRAGTGEQLKLRQVGNFHIWGVDDHIPLL